MFCGKCGKEIPDTTKFCPYCGAQTAGAAPAPPPGRPADPAVSGNRALAGRGYFRIILMVTGALHVLFFFVLSYGHLRGGRFLSGFAEELGFDVPTRLTGLNAIRVVSMEEESVLFAAVIFLLPLIFGALVLVLNAVGKKRGSYIASIALSGVTVVAYLVVAALLAAYQAVYNLAYGGIVFAFLVTFVQLGFSIAGCCADRRVKQPV